MKDLKDILTEAFLIKKHQNKQNDDCVDLDLPSCTLWSKYNVGAKKPEEYGLYFKWGNINGCKRTDKTRKFVSIKDYETTSGTKYKEGDILKSEDDAAYQTSKGEFRMPTKEETEELIKYTNNEFTELNGVKGIKFISKKDESKWIFIPAAGNWGAWCKSFVSVESKIYLWCSSKSSRLSLSYCLIGDSNKCVNNTCDTANALSIRGVLNK